LAAVVVLLLEVSLYKMMRQLSNRNTYVWTKYTVQSIFGLLK
jgi:hypothetical protein